MMLTSLELCDYAANQLKVMGFTLRYTSMKSEACYYGHPCSIAVIRVAAHRFGRTEARTLTMPVATCTTFPEKSGPRCMEAADTIIALAVGRYFLMTLNRDTVLGNK